MDNDKTYNININNLTSGSIEDAVARLKKEQFPEDLKPYKDDVEALSKNKNVLEAVKETEDFRKLRDNTTSEMAKKYNIEDYKLLFRDDLKQSPLNVDDKKRMEKIFDLEDTGIETRLHKTVKEELGKLGKKYDGDTVDDIKNYIDTKINGGEYKPIPRAPQQQQQPEHGLITAAPVQKSSERGI